LNWENTIIANYYTLLISCHCLLDTRHLFPRKSNAVTEHVVTNITKFYSESRYYIISRIPSFPTANVILLT